MQLTLFSIAQFKDPSHFCANNKIAPEAIEQFRSLIYDFYALHGRSFTWRHATNPYHVIVSEIMLQQTQTERVKGKFELFIGAFPNFEALSRAQFSEVLFYWQGLGYNRRALALHKMAKRIIADYSGVVPDTPDQLFLFDGIGKATAASICAFAYNKPTVFIETNIRTVYIHTFFQQSAKVHDSEILPLIEETVDINNPRIWYYALMDYGVALKKSFQNPSRKSTHHTKQSRFEGSERQIRGMILKVLTEHKSLSLSGLVALIPRDYERIERNLKSLQQEGFINEREGTFSLS
jgi:A/G-specific adenine glycosylase